MEIVFRREIECPDVCMGRRIWRLNRCRGLKKEGERLLENLKLNDFSLSFSLKKRYFSLFFGKRRGPALPRPL